MAKITVQNTDISVVKYNEEDYISLTDMARSQLQDEHGNIFAKKQVLLSRTEPVRGVAMKIEKFHDKYLSLKKINNADE